MCLKHGIFPKELKVAKIVPVYKKGDISKPENFRPISILPTISKLLEYLIADRISNFFEKNKFFTDYQHGYRKGRSVNTALDNTIQDILKALDQRKFVELVSVDLSRAFDNVNHDLLLNKLAFYGVRGIAYDILKSYLQFRKQVVVIDEKKSREVEVHTGIPQGSIMGPLLFIIFINDMPNNVPNSRLCLYADDTTIVTEGATNLDLKNTSDESVCKVKRWFRHNGLLLNEDKTQCITFHKEIGSSHVRSLKFLGIHLDGELKWSSHIEHLSKKLNGAIFCIRRIRSISTLEAAKLTYYTNFHSLISYGILFWGASSAAERAFVLQKRAIRALLKLGSRESCRSYFAQYKILTLPSIYIFNCIKNIHQKLYLLPKNCDSHNYHTRNKEELRIPTHRLSKTQNNATYWGIKFYNHLPKSVRDLPSAKMRNVVKNYLGQNAFYTIQEYLEKIFCVE